MTLTKSPVYLLADSRLLFPSAGARSSILKAACESVPRENPRAAYIGAANGDEPAYYTIFEAAMDVVAIRDRRHVPAEYDDDDRAYLRTADLVLLGGGDPGRGWDAIQRSGMRDDLLERHRTGATLVGISAGAVLLGLIGTGDDDLHSDSLFDALGLVPFVVDAHDEKNDWRRLRSILRWAGPAYTGLGLPMGSGAVVHPDGSLEPVSQSIIEMTWRNDASGDVLLAPQRGD